jgi:hypothetical protein
MMRTAGILLGSLLMTAFFLLVLNSGYQPRPVESAADSESPIQTGFGGPPTWPEVPDLHGDDRVAAPAAIAAAVDAADPIPGLMDERGSEDTDPGPVAGETSATHDTATLSRYPVWTPFRSQWAAAGFARRLTLATDVPVEVVNAAAGDYRVVFSYRDEGERQTRIRQIETVTGLELEP